MSNVSYKQSVRRYHRLFWPLMACYVVCCLGGAWLQRVMDPNPIWLAPALAIITALPIAVVFLVIWRYVSETDEFIRRRQLEALAIAGMTMASLAGLVGFLQIYDVIEKFDVFWFSPLFFMVYGLTNWMRGGKACE